MTVSAPEVRAAKSFLRQNAKAGTRDIPPHKFAAAAKELKVGFKQLIAQIAHYYEGGQNEAKYRQARIEREASKG
jgi:hypothetical protein